ncbi:MAG TPA: hypothetical protein PLT09_02045 [Deltaproteobacteria bacterium]|nr:hypothetical protein [Deltaproteobacteria bacterium]HPR56228.1 hypothetical protein [Deltaproteobacteria bacterium]HXK46195.1 hypothetical protein [Deltaproteobacteria bacterium]
MIYLKIMEVLKADADQLSRRVVSDLMNRGETEYHKKYSEDIIYERVYDVYSTLSYWLDRARPKEEIYRHFRELGRKRFDDGIPLHEVIMFLMLIKRHLWLYLLEKHFFESSYELMKSLEMNNRVVLFFDRAILAASMGYEEELMKYVEVSKEQSLIGKFFRKK